MHRDGTWGSATQNQIGGQSRNNAKQFLDENPEIAKEIENKIYAALGVDHDLVAPIERDEDIPEMPEVEAEATAAAEAAAAAA